MSGSRGTVALVLVVALLFDSMALSDAFCAGASFAPRQQARARRPARLPRQFARRSARNVDVMLSGEAMAIGVGECMFFERARYVQLLLVCFGDVLMLLLLYYYYCTIVVRTHFFG